MSEATEYYKRYLTSNGYTMENHAKTSRVSFLCDFIQEFTPKSGKVLDIGCGDMHLASLLPDYDWTGLDINTEQSKGRAIEQDLEKTPYPFDPESFDTIVCSEVLEHMFNPLAITKEIRRLIKPSGTYILSTPNFHYIDHYLQFFSQLQADLNEPWTYEHIRQYSLGSHEQLLHGLFKITRTVGADAQFSKFLNQGRNALRYALNIEDPDFIITDKVIGQMFPLHNHTIMLVTRPI